MGGKNLQYEADYLWSIISKIHMLLSRFFKNCRNFCLNYVILCYYTVLHNINYYSVYVCFSSPSNSLKIMIFYLFYRPLENHSTSV